MGLSGKSAGLYPSNVASGDDQRAMQLPAEPESPSLMDGDRPVRPDDDAAVVTGGLTGFASWLTDSWPARLLAAINRRHSPRVERVLVVVAAAVFIVATVVAWRSLPETDGPLSWPPLILAGTVGIAAMLTLNAVEYRMAARSASLSLGFVAAMRINVLASAAALLPLPGSVLVRVQGLRSAGATYRTATAAIAVVGVAWTATTFLMAGVAQIVAGEFAIGVAVLAGGVVLSAVAVVVSRRASGVTYTARAAIAMAAVQIGRVMVQAARFWLLVMALGASASAGQVVALTVAVSVSTAIAIFPGGLGIRELLAAGLAPLIGLPASVSLVVVAVDRLLGLVALGAAGIILGVVHRGHAEAEET